MIISITVEGFRNFVKPQTLWLTDDKNNIINGALIFGPNDAGKSNFLDAIRQLRYCAALKIRQSYYAALKLNKKSSFNLPIHPLLCGLGHELSRIKLNKIDDFKSINLELIVNNKYYRYSVSSKKDNFSTEEKITETITNRNGIEITNEAIKQKVRLFIYNKIIFPSDHISLLDNIFGGYNDNQLEFLEKFVPFFEKVVKKLDFDVKSVQIGQIWLGQIESPVIIENHQGFKYPVTEAAYGLKKIYFYLNILFNLNFFAEGGLVIEDDVDIGLHTAVIAEIFNWVNNNQRHNNVQIIAATHNTALMNYACISNKPQIKKEQIYFIDRGEISSLLEFKDIEKFNNLAHSYLAGRFDGVPVIEQL